MKPTCSVVLVEDHKIVRDGIKALILDEGSIEIIGEASSGLDCENLLKHLHPDVVLMDINLPDTTGIALTKKLMVEKPDLSIIMLSMHMGSEFITNSIEAGAKGYLPKTTSQEELVAAIKSVASGKEYYNDEVSEILLKNYISKTKNASKERVEQAIQLTKRELEILVLFARGFSNKEIAAELFISVRTVESHKNNIMQKLEIKSTVELVKYAIKHKLIEM
jgi:DNA-binding NarL/FixJ family response regulator